jgi:hypothetical protein
MLDAIRRKLEAAPEAPIPESPSGNPSGNDAQ